SSDLTGRRPDPFTARLEISTGCAHVARNGGDGRTTTAGEASRVGPDGPGSMWAQWRRGRVAPPGVSAESLQELRVRAGEAQALEQRLHRLDRLATGERAPQQLDALELVLAEQELLAPGSRPQHVERGKDAPIRQLAFEVELHVPGALELLEDDLVHPRACVHEGRADDREGATLLDLPRG